MTWVPFVVVVKVSDERGRTRANPEIFRDALVAVILARTEIPDTRILLGKCTDDLRSVVSRAIVTYPKNQISMCLSQHAFDSTRKEMLGSIEGADDYIDG
jgi:hypothetical protein